MGLALYRKYRPKGLGDVVGQNHIVTTLQNALKSGKISHAYLFTGPRGVGKTSVARILAHEINGLPYTDDSVHLDIIEIDAASNRRIDEIRDLRDKVHIAPTSAKYKVYIIDEVHMLTREAFNALLKTLEEPPAHAVFILATTEAHKVPDTIASRTQRFSFKPITRDDTVKHLLDLAKEEKIPIEKEAIEALADHGSGSFRDSINLLDQMVGIGNKITRADVEAMLGLPNPAVVSGLLDALESGHVPTIVKLLAEARIAGANAGTLSRALGEQLRSTLIASGAAPDAMLLQLLRQLVLASNERDAFLGLELALLEFGAVQVAPRVVAAPQPAAQPLPAPTTPSTPTTPVNVPPDAKVSVSVGATASASAAAAPDAAPAAKPLVLPETLTSPDEYWGALLAAIKKSHNTLYSMLRMAQPQLDGDTLTLVFGFAFHQKQMSQATNQQRIADLMSALLGRPIAVRSIHQKNATPTAITAAAVDPIVQPEAPVQDDGNTPLKDVASIFKGAELLE